MPVQTSHLDVISFDDHGSRVILLVERVVIVVVLLVAFVPVYLDCGNVLGPSVFLQCNHFRYPKVYELSTVVVVCFDFIIVFFVFYSPNDNKRPDRIVYLVEGRISLRRDNSRQVILCRFDTAPWSRYGNARLRYRRIIYRSRDVMYVRIDLV